MTPPIIAERGISRAELAVWRLVACDLPSKLIAERLGLRVRTVEVHRHALHAKLKVNTPVGLALCAIGAGIVRVLPDGTAVAVEN